MTDWGHGSEGGVLTGGAGGGFSLLPLVPELSVGEAQGEARGTAVGGLLQPVSAHTRSAASQTLVSLSRVNPPAHWGPAEPLVPCPLHAPLLSCVPSLSPLGHLSNPHYAHETRTEIPSLEFKGLGLLPRTGSILQGLEP